jgi:hypothetical protein
MHRRQMIHGIVLLCIVPSSMALSQFPKIPLSHCALSPWLVLPFPVSQCPIVHCPMVHCPIVPWPLCLFAPLPIVRLSTVQVPHCQVCSHCSLSHCPLSCCPTVRCPSVHRPAVRVSLAATIPWLHWPAAPGIAGSSPPGPFWFFSHSTRGMSGASVKHAELDAR